MISALNRTVGMIAGMTAGRQQRDFRELLSAGAKQLVLQKTSEDPFQRRFEGIRFGNVEPDGNTTTLNMRQVALGRLFGIDPLRGLTLEALRQGFVDANWKLMAEVIVMSKLEPDREQSLLLALDAGEAFLDKLVQTIRPTCSQEESMLLSNETVMLFVAQSLGWGETMQTEMDRPVYNRNVAQKLGMTNLEPTTNEVIATMQDSSVEALVNAFNINNAV